MPIVLTPEVLKGQAGQMQSLMSQYNSLFNGVTGTLNQVNSNWSANLSHNFSSKISSAQRSFSGILDTLQFGVNAANTSANSFLDVDSQLAKVLGGTATQVKTQGKVKNKKKSWWDIAKGVVSLELALGATLTSPIEQAKLLATGVAVTVKTAPKVVSALAKDYTNKGFTWQVLQTVKVGASTVAAIGGAAAAWGITAGSLGVGAPLASLVTVYSANTLANNFSDLYSIWRGDKNQVGQVNCLKTLEETAFGKQAGDVIYNVGSAVATAGVIIASIPALQGQLKQAPDMAKAIKGSGKELLMGAKAKTETFADFVTGKRDIMQSWAQMKLISKEMQNVSDLKKCVGVLATIGGKTKKAADAVAQTVYEAVNSGSKYQASWNLFGGDNIVIGTKDAIKDGKDAAKTAKVLFEAYLADQIKH